MSKFADKLNAYFDSKLKESLEVIGNYVKEDLKNELDTSYYVTPAQRKAGMINQSSSAGNPPHRRTGALREGIEYDVNGNVVTISSSRVGKDPEVPSHLEWGTSQMAARPYMRPEINELKTKLPEILKEAFK